MARDRLIVDALVDPARADSDAELAQALAAWPGPTYWSEESDGRRLVLIRVLRPPAPERWPLLVGLFFLTALSTLVAGAMLAGALPGAVAIHRWHGIPLPGLPGWSLARLAAGWTFSLPLLAILLAHEAGHYLSARRYRIDVSPPYFLPAPPWLSIIGTLGAFIRLRSPVADRRQLMDVAAAGPIAGMIVALPVLALGLALSLPVTGLPLPSGQFVVFDNLAIFLGDSPLTLALRGLFAPGVPTLRLHPTAFAGWLGVFVTMLNLLPLAQLDGGHIVYALFDRWHTAIGRAVWLGLLALGFLWPGWWLWAAAVLIVGRGRLRHPAVVDRYRPLPRSRGWAARAVLILFGLTFMPVPFVL